MSKINGKTKVKVLKGELPKRHSEQAAGFDLKAAEKSVIKSGKDAKIQSGIAIELPENSFGLIKERSSLAVNKKLFVLSGVIDQDYRGELLIHLFNFGAEDQEIAEGERIAQLIVIPIFCEIEKVETLSKTERGEKDFTNTHSLISNFFLYIL